MKRFLRISLAVLVIVGGARYVRHYLRSARIAHGVATRLEQVHRAPVTALTTRAIAVQAAQPAQAAEVAQAGGAGVFPDVNVTLARAASAAVSGMHTQLTGILDFGERFVGGLPKKVKPAPAGPDTATKYLDLNLKLKDVDLGKLVKSLGLKIDVPVAGKLSLQVKASIPTNRSGDFKAYKAKGAVQLTGLNVAGVAMESLDANVNYAGGVLNLTNIDLRLYGGEATGSAVLPLAADSTGKVNLKLSQLDMKQLAKDFALPVKIEGKLDASIKGSLPPAPKGQTRTATLDLDVSAPKLRVQNIPIDRLRGKLDYKSGVIDYKLDGKTLGGTFELEGQVPGAAPVKKESKKGRLRIDNVALSRLMRAFNLQDTVPIAGRLNVTLDFTQDTPTREPQGKGRLRFTNLRWQETLMATALDGELILADRRLRLPEIAGRFARGEVRLAADFNVRDPARSRFRVILDNVDAATILAPLTGERIKGRLQARIRGTLGGGTLGGSWRGTADLQLTGGEILGMEVSQAHVPADWHYSPATGRVQIEVYEADAQIARGRAMGKLSAARDYTWRIDGNVRVSGVDLQTLIKPFAGTTQVAAGTVTGRFDFNGSEVRSLNDFRGTLVASFSQAQALQIPGLQQIAPFIGMGPSATFQRGELRAHLDRSTLRVQKLALQGANLQLFADGTVGIQRGTLDLRVVAKAGDVCLPTIRLGVLGLQIPISGPLPLTLVQEASALLANRVIDLTVTGTIRSPVVTVRPLRMLSEEAVRFFLNRANLPIPVAP